MNKMNFKLASRTTSENASIGIVIIAVIAIAIVLIIGTGSTKTKTVSMSSTMLTSSVVNSAVATNTVKLTNYMFSPMVIKVKVGTTVTWTNTDQVPHSVTADTASQYAPNSQLFGQNQTYQFTFTKTGTYELHCELHPFMHADVIVTS